MSLVCETTKLSKRLNEKCKYFSSAEMIIQNITYSERPQPYVPHTEEERVEIPQILAHFDLCCDLSSWKVF
jgi:hypothetical protein